MIDFADVGNLLNSVKRRVTPRVPPYKFYQTSPNGRASISNDQAVGFCRVS